MKSIVMCGIPRSGSTLVWQILQAVFPGQDIPKTHPDMWMPDGSTAVISIRDPRDVVASLYRVRLSRDHKEIGNHDDVANVIQRTLLCFEALKTTMTGPHIILRYENFFSDHYILYQAIETNFGIHTPLHIQKQISDRFSVEANRKRAAALNSFNEVDTDQIHGDHIGHVTPGYWSTYLPWRTVEWVAAECKGIAKEWGYED